MAVKIRLARRGKKRYAMYDVVVSDSRSPRDGRFIEKIGTYNPNTNPATIKLNEEKAFEWVMNGAVPTDTVKAMLSYRGILFKKHLKLGVLKGAITQEQADAKLQSWLDSKNAKIQGKVDNLTKAKKDAQKARLDAETKVKEDRAKAIAEKQKAQEAQPVAENTETTETTPEQGAE
ncbi:MAG: 30S ribosomal protein S16 [Raineya sp.]|jgi:small subunit ribosomal protein S16|nr:30S ribosomal protein S16 [Raineya sp.]